MRRTLRNRRRKIKIGPVAALVRALADEVFALLRSYNRDLGTTFLVVTHDPRLARRCDRVLDLVDGRITGATKGSDLAPRAEERRG